MWEEYCAMCGISDVGLDECHNPACYGALFCQECMFQHGCDREEEE